MDEEKKVEESSEESMEEKENRELTPEEVLHEKEMKIKNLISAVILIAGLFVGSLFVDIVQLMRGGGFSQRALSSTDVFESNGRTWVAYSDPMVKVQVLTDDSCGDACKPDEVLVGLKQAIPTLLTEKIDVNSAQGKKLVAEFGIKTIPAFIFSKGIEKTDLFAKAQPFLDKKDDGYAIKSAEAGFPVGKYIATPQIDENDIKTGPDDAKVKVVEFTDFQCPICKTLHQTVINQIIKDYGDKVQVVVKNFPLPIHQQAQAAALAAECANAQGKFSDYADKLFATQDAWGKLKDAKSTFKGYAAQLGLNTGDFNKCLDGNVYQPQITQSLQDGQSFGIQGTPAMFVGNSFQNGLVKYDDVKKIIDDQLAK